MNYNESNNKFCKYNFITTTIVSHTGMINFKHKITSSVSYTVGVITKKNK